MALPCFLWGSGSRASGGVCVRAVCSGLGLRSCSATPPPPLADSVSAVSAGEGPRRPAPRVPGDTRRAAQDQPSEERQRHSDTAAAGVTGRCRLRGGGGGDPTPSGGRRTAEASGEGGQRRPPAGRQPALSTAAGTGKMPGSAGNGFAACHLRRGACQRGRHWQEHRHCQMTVEALPACGKEGQGEGGGMALGGGVGSQRRAGPCQGGCDLEKGRPVPGAGHWCPVADAAGVQGAAPALHLVGCIREALGGPGWLTRVLEAASCTCPSRGRCQQRGARSGACSWGRRPSPAPGAGLGPEPLPAAGDSRG